MVSLKREGLAASVLIAVTNRTNEVLEARRQWVKGGEACNRAVRTVLEKQKYAYYHKPSTGIDDINNCNPKLIPHFHT